MKHILLLATLLGVWSLSGQIYQPVKWTTNFERIDDRTFDLEFTARIDDGWYVYSHIVDDGGPIPTTFHFNEADHFEQVGKLQELSDHRKVGFDKYFEMEVVKFAREVTFIQRVRLRDFDRPVEGYLEFMTCNDKNCLPPAEVEFSFVLPAPAATAAPATGAATVPAPGPAAAPPASSSRSLLEPASWSGELKRLSDDTYELIFHAALEEGWYTYSQFLEEDGPVPTSIHLLTEEGVELLGLPQESAEQRLEEEDPFFGMKVVKLKKKATFRRQIRVADPEQAVEGFVEFMVCDASRCLPPQEVPFRALPNEGRMLVGGEAAAPPAAPSAPSIGEPAAGPALYDLSRPDLSAPAGQCGEVETVATGSGYRRIFLLGFIGGLLALLTPCVFPMIPLTVSFFTKSAQTRQQGVTNASLYGFFILLVYLLLSLPFHLMDSINPDILNDISTNVWLNVAFFLIFLFFAFSFFGYFELTLPASWTNKASSAEGIGGAVGIFFMALTLALVSFSCTGPILGSLLAGALTADGGALQLTTGMAGFGLALALPFGLFAAFPGWMNTLPRSGGWLNSVKVVLGFLELALALKFLSNADLVKHWGLLRIEPFLGLWIVIFLGLGLYLFGRVRFPHDSPVRKLPFGRIALGLLSFAFVIYLASGFTYDRDMQSYRPLKLLSGLAPPVCYSFFNPCDCPQNLACFRDLNEGLVYARQVNKPVLLDFTGYACVNCRKMEEHVWPEKEVYDRLRDDYVLISLYVDDKKALPSDQQIEVTRLDGGTRRLRTYGQKWSHFQIEYFQTNAQPFYVLISPEGELLNSPVGYTPDPAEYAQFLACGKETFDRLAAGKENDKPLKELASTPSR